MYEIFFSFIEIEYFSSTKRGYGIFFILSLRALASQSVYNVGVIASSQQMPSDDLNVDSS